MSQNHTESDVKPGDDNEHARKETKAIVDFLSHWLVIAEETAAKCSMSNTPDAFGYMKKQSQYWHNVASGIRWLLFHADQEAYMEKNSGK